MTESFASYLAKNYIATKGFKLGTVPEARKIADANDIVLTRMDGMTLHIICIIDAEMDPNKRLALSIEEIKAIGQQCAKYTGRIGRTKMPVAIYIYKVGALPITSELRQSMKVYKGSQPTIIQAGYIDTVNKVVYVNTVFNGLFRGRLFIEKLLQNPRVNTAELQKNLSVQTQILHRSVKRPWLTGLLIGLLLATFGAEQYFAITPGSKFLTPSIRTLLALGALHKGAVEQFHEYFRLLSTAFLHAGPIHLALNCICLYVGGIILENLVGRWWLGAIFSVSAIGGALMSLTINPPNMISVGASGAIMGLLASAYIFSYRLPPHGGRIKIQMQLMQILIPSLLPIAIHLHAQKVDFAAHLGGMISGLFMSCLILKLWPRNNPTPNGISLAIFISVTGLLGFTYALYRIILEYPHWLVQ